MTSKTFSTGTPFCPSPDMDGLSDWSFSDIDDTPLYPLPALYEASLSPPPALGGLPFWPQSDIPLSPSPNNYDTPLLPTLSATPIKYEGFWGTHLVPPTLDTQTLPQVLDEDQGFIFNLGEGNVQPGMSEKERIRKLEKEIKEMQNLKTIMFNELVVGARKRAGVDEVKQRFEDTFIYFFRKKIKQSEGLRTDWQRLKQRWRRKGRRARLQKGLRRNQGKAARARLQEGLRRNQRKSQKRLRKSLCL
jgi:hypothetical protein